MGEDSRWVAQDVRWGGFGEVSSSAALPVWEYTALRMIVPLIFFHQRHTAAFWIECFVSEGVCLKGQHPTPVWTPSLMDPFAVGVTWCASAQTENWRHPERA